MKRWTNLDLELDFDRIWVILFFLVTVTLFAPPISLIAQGVSRDRH